MADGSDVTFTPIPARAIGDARFSAIHFRLLGQIALHDRLSQSRGKGAGCWASNKTLAERCGVNYTNLSVALKQLGEWGYITRVPHPLSKKTSVLRVIYDCAADRAQCGREGAPPDAEPLPKGKPSRSLPMGKASEPQIASEPSPNDLATAPSGDEGLPRGKTSADIVCPVLQQASEIAELPENNIFRETGKILRRNVEPYSVETAPALRASDGLRNRRSANAGAFLAIVERELNAGAPLDRATRSHLESIAEGHEPRTPEHQCAHRLLETYGE